MADFDRIFPYCEMQEVEVDGQKLIQIPRFYIRNEVLNDGVAYAGKYAAQISDRPKTGFHIHPAFVKNNAVLSCIQYGAYEASMAGYPNGDHYDSSGKTKVISNIKACSVANAKPWNYIFKEEAALACAARNTGTDGSEQSGFHLHNIYEVYAIAHLMLIEYGASNMQELIGRGHVDQTWTTSGNQFGDDKTVKTGTTNAVWRGIHELWGNVWEHTDGAYTDANGQLYIFSNRMDGTYVATGFNGPSADTMNNPGTQTGATTYKQRAGFMKSFSHLKGAEFDLGDVICPSVLVGASTDASPAGSIHDHAWHTARNHAGSTVRDTGNERYRPQTDFYAHGSFGHASRVGPFVWYVNLGSAGANNGFRLARYGAAIES